ncbi:MAG TPA: hypothetical protein PL190_06180 [Caldisericia bacterium]|nr:MAG: hypothetical protein BWX90_00918 [bacterium ADurb.Bin132]HNY61601.1 hypothetical protein [Caldisericia bacterium]HOC79922.1 hypothetical protein [Caldisericia bacterium]HOG70602.1 hypothetical protein [Caldisericia bacterium]HPA66093.1 hypothetical protein [Caldisericia bacterium]
MNKNIGITLNANSDISYDKESNRDIRLNNPNENDVDETEVRIINSQKTKVDLNNEPTMVISDNINFTRTTCSNEDRENIGLKSMGEMIVDRNLWPLSSDLGKFKQFVEKLRHEAKTSTY